MSTNYSKNGKLVRIGLEPLGVHAGTSRDPLNQTALRLFYGELAIHFPHVDLSLLNHFESCFSLSPEEYRLAASLPASEKNMQVRFAGFNFQRNGDIVPKGYFAFGAKATVQGVSKTVLALKALRTINSYSSDLKYIAAVSHLEDFLTSTGLEPLVVGTDCIEFTKSRIKVYVKAPEFTTAGLRDLWTLGGRVNTSLRAKGLEIAEYLMGLMNYKPEHQRVDLEFSSLLANYELKIGSPHPKPQVYFPLHKVDDEEASDVITRFFDYLGWHGIATTFKEDLISNMPSASWKENKKIQKWFAYAYSEAGVYLTVYYNPASARAGSQ
ncbi:aromatic prenyltransferase [Aspergillus pseudoustus]|uniref:Aromatic prenyltransferase n=1 Tax=Aspergillus pseudoustus TaxID=1810923 RepID=A0ABR4JJ06_9EURO